MKTLALALGLAASLAASHTIAAPSFSLGGYTGPITIKFKNFENVDPTLIAGAQNYGILNITNITDPIGNNLWTSGGANGFLAGVFSNLTVLSAVPSGPGLFAEATGGLMNIYLSSTAPDAMQGLSGYSNAGCATNTLCYNTISNTGDGILFLSLAFASGADPTNGVVTVSSTFNTTTFPTTGHASSFLNVTGGDYGSTFDNDGFVTAFGQRDISIENDFCANGQAACGATVGDWQLQSDDPARANFIPVPEPATTALFGLGLLAMGLGLCRRT